MFGWRKRDQGKGLGRIDMVIHFESLRNFLSIGGNWVLLKNFILLSLIYHIKSIYKYKKWHLCHNAFFSSLFPFLTSRHHHNTIPSNPLFSIAYNYLNLFFSFQITLSKLGVKCFLLLFNFVFFPFFLLCVWPSMLLCCLLRHHSLLPPLFRHWD